MGENESVSHHQGFRKMKRMAEPNKDRNERDGDDRETSSVNI